MSLKQAIRLFNQSIAATNTSKTVTTGAVAAASGASEDFKSLLHPRYVSGKWLKPKVSARQKAMIVKSVAAMAAGMEGKVKGLSDVSALAKEGKINSEWIYDWESPRAFKLTKPPKGHQFERVQEKRAANIKIALGDMDEKIKLHREEQRSKRSKSFLEKSLEKAKYI